MTIDIDLKALWTRIVAAITNRALPSIDISRLKATAEADYALAVKKANEAFTKAKAEAEAAAKVELAAIESLLTSLVKRAESLLATNYLSETDAARAAQVAQAVKTPS